MQKFSSFGRKKKQTKIRHRMVMLEDLQLSHVAQSFVGAMQYWGMTLTAYLLKTCTVLIKNNKSILPSVLLIRLLTRPVTLYHLANLQSGHQHEMRACAVKCTKQQDVRMNNTPYSMVLQMIHADILQVA